MMSSAHSSELLISLWNETLRRDPRDPYAWSMVYRRMGSQPMRHLPALAAIARDDHPFVVVQKSAQVGLTELFVTLAMWACDTEYAGRGTAFFIMPTADQMADFAQARFDRAIQDSPYLRARLQPEPPRRKGVDSKRLKRIGNGHLYMRGAESLRQITSVPADMVLLDEFDQMHEGVLEAARKRLTSSRAGLLRLASTPRYPETGVNGLFLHSDQHYYHLPCGACGLWQRLTWEANVDLERAQVVCWNCRQPLDRSSEGQWVASAPGNARIRGYHLSRLYSPWLDLREMIEASGATTPSALQEFQNSDLGETFVPPGGGLSIDALDQARCDYELDHYAGEPCVMGVDVGLNFHVVIREDTLRRVETRSKITEERGDRVSLLWFAGQVSTWDELDALRQQFNVRITVIDSQPETHGAREFAARDPEHIWLARYQPSAQVPERNYSPPRTVQVDRTVALDATFERFRKGGLKLPCAGARALGGSVRDGVGEYYREVMALHRTLEQDAQGNWRSRWLDGSRPDHYAHAEVYCWLADHIADMSRTFVLFPRVGMSYLR
jgi:hypothetical protein